LLHIFPHNLPTKNPEEPFLTGWLLPLLERGCQIYCGFDADPTGDQMARAMITLHPTVKRLCFTVHDWNDLLRA